MAGREDDVASLGSSAHEPGKAEAGTPRDYSEKTYRFYLKLVRLLTTQRVGVYQFVPLAQTEGLWRD